MGSKYLLFRLDMEIPGLRHASLNATMGQRDLRIPR
jgi:hypothetical protein